MSILKYNDYIGKLLLEFNNADKEVIKSLDDYFTVAIEYEICSTEHPEDEPSIEDEDGAIDNTINQTLLDLSRGKTIGMYMFSDIKWTEKVFNDNEDKMISENPNFDKLSKKKQNNLHKKYKTWTWVRSFLSKLSECVDFDDLIESLDNLESIECDDELEKTIVNRFKLNMHQFCFSQNMDYLIERLQNSLPNFWKNGEIHLSLN